MIKFYDSIPGSIVTTGKIAETLIMCACWEYYFETLDLSFIRVICDPSSSPSSSGSYMPLMNLTAFVTGPRPWWNKGQAGNRNDRVCRQGFFYREPSAAGSHDWPPAPLGWKLANARNTTTVENNRNWAKLLLHDVYFIRSKIHRSTINHGCKTTICWFSWTCNESKITLYYWLHTMTLCNLQIHWLSFLFLPLLNSLLFHCLWKPAK